MKRKIVWLVVSGLMVLALLAASCAPAVEEAAPAEKPAAPAVEVAPAEKPAAPIGTEMVKVSLKKLDGTVVEKMVEKPRYGGELIVVKDTSILGWDDAYQEAGPIASNLDRTHERLLQGDWTMGPAGTGEVTWALPTILNLHYHTGSLAESWEMVQPDTLIFHIRQGVRFGLNPALEASRLVGGRELTADDIVWNLRRVYFEIKGSGPYKSAGVSRPVDVYATDKWTVVVKALPEQMWATLSYVSAFGVNIFPPEVAKKWGDFNDWKRVVGTGAFILTDYVAMNQITWVRNSNYWGKDPLFPANQLPYVDTVKMLIIPDASTRLSALRTGRVDVDTTRTIEWENAASLQKTSPQLKSTKIVGQFTFLGGRMDKPELPFKDIRVRRALMMAVNYQEMADTYYGGNAIVFAFPIAPIKEWEKAFTPLEELGLAPDGFDTKKLYGYHPEEAKKLLAEAGYPNGFKTEVLLQSKDVDFASMIKAYWAKNLNVDLALDVKEIGVWTSINNAAAHKEMIVNVFNTALGWTLTTFRSGRPRNTAMLFDPEIEVRYNRMAALEPWSDEWFKVVKENNVYVTHLALYIVSPLMYNYVFWQPWLKGYTGELNVGSMYAQFPKYIWIDQELKKAMGR